MDIILNIIGIIFAAAIVVGAVAVAWYKWYYNTRADFSYREEKEKGDKE